MNKNFLTASIVAIVVICIGILYFVANGNRDASDINTDATNTPAIVQNNNGGTTPGVYVPPAPASPLVVTDSNVSVSDNTAVVKGTVNPRGAFANYWYEYGNSSTLGSKTLNQNIGSGYTAIPAAGFITNLTKNTTYYYRLVAENQYGQVNGSVNTFKTTQGVSAPVGSIPTVKTLASTNVTRTTADINAEITPNKAITQYWFEYGKTTQFGNISPISTTNNGSTQITVVTSLADLSPLTKYYYRINAQNQFGTVNGSITSFTTSGPAEIVINAPVSVTRNATSVSTSTAVLHGVVTPNNGETKYWFEYSKEAMVGTVVPEVTNQITLNSSTALASVKADISGLTGKTTYYFRLVAQNSKGTVRGDSITFKTR